MTEMKDKLKMIWYILKGRSVMYKIKVEVTSDCTLNVLPKTKKAWIHSCDFIGQN